ncbi:ABC transporter ATP-binding protein [Paenibacillus sp. IHB B 3415]|uniref:ABC transporter ATP-binding protein n=1 Tax=Paenibacillus sp. IHB B 3415 TaxID=867080 RepID=UPI00069B546D|nr:energy-coupling factor ABC transporter ATP-binding protein [Paenibacillus sp. IHB B 3415]
MDIQTIIEFENVSFQYNDSYEQLSGVNLSVAEGECVVITGPSGSGKTTLTRMLNGLIPNFYEGKLTGSVRLKGRDIHEIEPWSFGRTSGSVFQDSRSQFFTSVVADEIAFSGENYGLNPSLILERVSALAEEFRITGLLSRGLHGLSSGEKQKTAFASARLTDPELFVMDEPSANLDMAATRELGGMLSALKARGKTIVIAEHRLYYLLPLADRIIYMAGGQITAEWTRAGLLALTSRELDTYGLRSPVVSEGADNFTAQAEGQERRNRQQNLEHIAVEHANIAPGRFKRAVLEDLSFVLNRGEIAALTGPNGAGKTTLARTLCGLLREREGVIRINGEPCKANKRLRKMWFVMQDSDYQLFSDSVRNELLMTHEDEPDAARRAERLLKELDLWEYREHHPASLSGGQKQRLTFAVGLMNRPDMIILDEPTSGLDGRNMRRVIKLIREMAESGVTVLVITHDYELVCGACDRLLLLDDGKLQADLAVTSATVPEVIRLMQAGK